MFHRLARSCADLLIGSAKARRSQKAWRQVYRALEHGVARNACLNQKIITKFPLGIKRFADTFVIMQEKRHAADYEPNSDLCKSEVLQDIADVEATIKQFVKVPTYDRRAFAALVLFKNRNPTNRPVRNSNGKSRRSEQPRRLAEGSAFKFCLQRRRRYLQVARKCQLPCGGA